MIVVSDTTPLNYLILVDAADVLPNLFGQVYAPSAVLKELSHARSPELVRTWAGGPPAWLIVQDPTHVDPSLKLGPGEAAAIALAQELKADWVLLDERRGSREAERRGFRVTGTLGLIEEAAASGLLDYEQTRDRLVAETTFYVTDDVLRESEERIRQRPFAAEQSRKAQEQSRATEEPAEGG
jgi:predicted nucleic acid-binding protein